MPSSPPKGKTLFIIRGSGMTNGVFLLKPRIPNYNCGTLEKADQFRDTFKPELDVAEQLGREIFRPQLALAHKFPLFRGRVRHTVAPHDPPQFHRLARRHFTIFPFPKRQILPTNDTPEPAGLVHQFRHFLLLGNVSFGCVGERAFCCPYFLNPRACPEVRKGF